MTVNATLPVQRAPLIDDKGCMTLPYYRYFLGFNNNQSGSNSSYQQQISQIATDLGSPDGSVDNIPPLTFDTGSIEGIDSIAVSGSLQDKGVVKISLVGDASFKQQGSFYGFANNQMGFFLLQNILQSAAPVTVSTSNLGITTFGLQTVTPTSGGTLQATAFDAYGRISETQAITWATAGAVSLSYNAGTNTVSSSLNVTGVAAGTYGDATHVGQVTVNAQGQVTAASSVAISFPAASLDLATLWALS